MTVKDKIQNLRRKYESFKKGTEDVLTVRDEARLVLEEVGDMLMELEFSIEEDKCKCHRKRPSC